MELVPITEYKKVDTSLAKICALVVPVGFLIMWAFIISSTWHVL